MEWCEDAWHENYDGAPTDGSFWEDVNTSKMVLRGGSWNKNALACQAAHRFHSSFADKRHFDIGFRVVCELQ
jgi:formylglycine-generating enzyme required for sulfatase activity